MSRAGRYTLQWKDSHFSSSKDTFTPNVKKTFRNIEYHALTHGYGTLRDAGYQLKGVLSSLNAPMMASFVVLPGSYTREGLPCQFLAFVHCDSEEMIRELYLVSETGTFCFNAPLPGFQPQGWKYTIKPPIPRYEYPGNLVFQIKRPRGDTRQLRIHAIPSPVMNEQEIWAFPDASDLAPRRLVNCANLTRSLGTDADNLRRYLCASDLQEKEDSRYSLFQNLNDAQEKIVNSLLRLRVLLY